MVLQTVSAITTDDGRGNTSTTNYAYEGGLWDAEERRFLGFRKATTTLPCIAGETACPYSETTFPAGPGLGRAGGAGGPVRRRRHAADPGAGGVCRQRYRGAIHRAQHRH